MPVDHHLVKVLFLAAAELPAAQRPAFLEARCADAPEVRRRVEALLQAVDEQGSNFWEAPTVGAGEPAKPGGETPGTWIGPYQLLEQIGEGGMGTVWLAEQEEPVARQV